MNKIITISREFGSGGREVGKRLSDVLGFKYYDKEIIEEIAKRTGTSNEYVGNISEMGLYNFPFQFGKTFYSNISIQANQTEILVMQQKILKEIAKEGDCIIVGRGADVILKEYNPMNIFVYSNMESKIERCRKKGKENENFSDKELKNKIKQIDKERIKFHDVLSNLEWGEKENYDLCINTSNLEIKKIIPSLAEYITNWFEGRK